MTTCPHAASDGILFPPKATQPVYREDCTICFDSIDDPAGLDVCLHCFNGGCAGERMHSRAHARTSQHPLAVNIRRTRRRQHRDDGQPPEKISKLEIRAETEEARYLTQTDVHCFECGFGGISKEGRVGEVVESVLRANTFAREAEVQAWQQEITPCEHTLCLEQEDGRQIPTGDLGHCRDCDLKENLWLCLTCGNLGCGRMNFMGLGPPGNNHQVEHNKATGHPVAVKLGSLTADGNADIHCYACDEERSDPELVAHLAQWGIDIAGRVKTEKSVTEMQLEHNLTFDFSMTTADGKALKALYGPGLTGLKNLGNSCYLASILQSLFSMPEFSKRYYRPEESVEHVNMPAEDVEVQLRKLADGLLSGRYSVPDKDSATDETEGQFWQKGIVPAMLKHLIGKGHSEFGTMRQQDSFELLLHLLKLISRSQQAARAQFKEVTDPVDAFRFVMEQRLQCLNCKKVRYRQDEMENLSVAVPIKRLPQKEKPDSDGIEEMDKEIFEPVTLTQCLDNFTGPEVVDLTCSSCKKTGFTKQTLFKTFPKILAVNARRFEIVNWLPTKQDVPVIIDGELIDFDRYRSKGKQEDEEELQDEKDTEAQSADSGAFVANSAALEGLMSMGFPQVRCEKALHATGNSDAEMAAAWLFEHMEDPDIDTPVNLGGGSGGDGGPAAAADPEKIESLNMMGFSTPQARQALRETGGDMERAVDWLFSHPDAVGDFEESTTDIGAPQEASGEVTKASTEQDMDMAVYRLNSIVCHKGASIHAGHYVAFVNKRLNKDGTYESMLFNGERVESKNTEWVLFNDEKVALGGDVEEMKKFAYIYFFRRQVGDTWYGLK